MDKRILKAKAKREKIHPMRSWWRKNGYKVWRVILFPAWIYYSTKNKRKEKEYKELQFSPELCKAYLDNALPSIIAHDCEDVRCFLISDADDMGDLDFSDLFDSRVIKEKYRGFFSKFRIQSKEYILNEYIIDGYEKTQVKNRTDWERISKKYGWRTPWQSDYCTGVVFESKS